MNERLIIDRLRDEYFSLLPEARLIVSRLETEIRFQILPIQQRLKRHEQLIVKSRIKDCQSAVDTARRKGNQGRGEGKVFDPERTGDYSVLSLPDLVGVRVLVFPDRRLREVDQSLRTRFAGWRYDPICNSKGIAVAHKYDGKFDWESGRVASEYQVVPMLLGLCWDVEHSALYKSELNGSKEMSTLHAKVEDALSDFESGIANLLPDEPTVVSDDTQTSNSE